MIQSKISWPGKAIQTLTLTLAFLGLITSSGCQILPHSLQPHQLWKLNRGRQLGVDTYDFSVPPAGQETPDMLEQSPPFTD